VAGQPKTRAKRAAAAAKSAGGSSGSRARGQAGKGKAKGKAAGARNRPRFEPASIADYQAVAAAEAKALAVAEKKSPLSPEDRVARDESIVAMWALGMTPTTISERVELTPGHVREVIAAHRQRRASMPIPSSSELLWDMLDRVEALIERTSLLASSASLYGPDGEQRPNDAVRLGAMRTLIELYTSQAGLWQAMGLVTNRPSDDLRSERARDMLRRLLDELRRLGVSQEDIDAAARRVLVPGAGDDDKIITLEGRATG
jgi:hypothetical protein